MLPIRVLRLYLVAFSFRGPVPSRVAAVMSLGLYLLRSNASTLFLGESEQPYKNQKS